MSFSLGEVRAMAKLAARGAGYSWGEAEEIAIATRWLAEQGLPAVEMLDALLAVDAPHPTLALGFSLMDDPRVMSDLPRTLPATDTPLFLLAFLARASLRDGVVYGIISGATIAMTDGRAASVEGRFKPQASAPVIDQFTALGPTLPKQTRAIPNPNAWARLTALAARTYAPATDESRRLGAGAGLTDND